MLPHSLSMNILSEREADRTVNGVARLGSPRSYLILTIRIKSKNANRMSVMYRAICTVRKIAKIGSGRGGYGLDNVCTPRCTWISYDLVSPSKYCGKII